MTGADLPAAEGLDLTLGADGVLRVVLDRPEKHNALTDVMVAALIEALERAATDEAVRTVEIRGAGEHFCAGFDIVARNARASTGETAAARPRAGSIQRRLAIHAHRLLPLVASVQVPVVCVVRGWAAGIGLHLAAAADFTVAADTARFWEPFAQRGFTPDSGGTWFVPRRVGDTRARELLLLGRELSGSDAAAWGLIHRAVPEAQLDAAATDLVGHLAGGATVALGLTKWLLHAGAAAPLEAQLSDEAFAMELSSRTEDFREGLSAFAERRPPRFRGR